MFVIVNVRNSLRSYEWQMLSGVSFARMAFTVFPICAAKVYVIIYMTKFPILLIISIKCGIETMFYVV